MPSTTAKPAAATVHRRRNRFVRRFLPYAAAALLALLFCGYIFGLRNRGLSIPIAIPTGDYLLSATIVKGVMQHGWYTTNPMVGAPYGLEFHDFPMAEGLHFVFYLIAGLLHLPVTVAMNLHYLLGYILITLTSLYVFRRLRLPLAPSIAASLLFAFMPHHWMRDQRHLMLSSYYMIPLTVLVILWLAKGDEFVRRAPQGAWFRYRFTRAGVAAAVICALTGSAGIYYAAFGMAFLLIMTVYRLVRRPDLSQALTGLMPVAVIALFLLLNTSPSIVYWIHHGANHSVGTRSAAESDLFGLKLTQLLLPISGHRIPLMSRWKYDYLVTTNQIVPQNDATAALGIVAGLGFLWLVAWLFFGQDDDTPDGQLLTHLSVVNMAAVLIGAIGGFGTVFALTVSPQLRAGHRISIYIAFFCLLAVLILIRRIELRWFHRKTAARLFRLAAAAVLFAGLWDITPPTLAAPPDLPGAVESDRKFIQAIEAAVPRGSMIYQLPYHPFPEYGYTNKMLDYDPLRGYVYSDHLRWSYGAMKGRPADEWQKELADLPAPQLLATIVKAGFQGVYIDRLAYVDEGKQLIGEFDALLAESPIRSADQRFVFFPITKYAAGQGASRDKVLRLPIGVNWQECSASGKNYWCPYDAELQFENRTDETRTVHLQAVFQSATGASATLSFGPPISQVIDIAAGAQPFSTDLTIPPGRVRIRLHSNAQRLVAPNDPRILVFAIMNPEIRGL